MKKNDSKTAIFILLFFVSGISYGQNTKIDSLNLLINSGKEKTAIIDYRLEKTKEYLKIDNLTNAEKELEIVFNQLDTTRFNDQVAKGYYFKGKLLYEQNQIKQSLDYFFKIILNPENISDYKILSDANFEIGYVYTQIGILDHAIIYLEKSNSILPDKGNEVEKAKTINNIGYINELLGNYELAINYYRKALSVFEEYGDKKAAAYAYNNIGALYREIEKFDDAIIYYHKSYEIKLEIGDTAALATTYNNFGVVYEKKNELDTALYYYRLALSIAKKFKMKQNEARTINNIGRIKELQGDFDSALVYYFQSYDIKEKISDNHGKILSFLNIGSAYFNNNNFEESVFYYNKGIELADSLGFIKELSSLYKEISFSYEKLNNYKSALDYYKKYSEINDTLVNEEKQKRIEELEIVYQTEQKEKELLFLKKENETKEKILSTNKILMVLLIILLILVVAFFYNTNKKQKLNAQNKSLVLEQKLLRTQMNPHFMFNSLSSIQAFIYENEPLKAGKYISNFATLMRLMLDNSRNEMILITKEIETLEYYLKLQKLRFRNKFDYEIHLSNNINPDNTFIPPMLAQPLIENSIEHGVRNLKKQGKIEVYFNKQDNNIKIEIIDNGLGLSQNGNGLHKGSKSYAIQIINERLTTFSKNGKNIVILEEIKDDINEVKGTKASFYIPSKNQKDAKNNNN